MYKLQLWGSLTGWVHCVRSSLTAKDNCCFRYTFPSGWLQLLPCSDVYGIVTKHHGCKIGELIFTTKIAMSFSGRIITDILSPVVRFYSSCMAQPLLPFLRHGIWPTSYNVVMLEISSCSSTQHYMAGAVVFQCRICVTFFCGFYSGSYSDLYSNCCNVTATL